MMMNDELRAAVVAYAQRMAAERLVHGTSGNISAIDRAQGLVAITPTGVEYETLGVDDVSVIDLTGQRVAGLAPSSEMPMHLAFYRERPDIQAIVHTHSMYATAFAVMGEPILAVHYVVTSLGGDRIPVTPRYVLYGTEELARLAVQTMGETYRAVLLRNHGVVALGPTVAKAYQSAATVEEMAELYYHTRQLGTPQPLSPAAIAEVMEAMRTYGQPPTAR